jgi:hypothetical protein
MEDNSPESSDNDSSTSLEDLKKEEEKTTS